MIMKFYIRHAWHTVWKCRFVKIIYRHTSFILTVLRPNACRDANNAVLMEWYNLLIYNMLWHDIAAAEVRNVLFRAAKEAFRHRGKGFSALRKRLSGNAKHALRTHETHRTECRKSLSCNSSTSGRDRSWHETHVQNAKRRYAEAGMGNAGA